ncbi:MAG: PSD1 and planctomycete cytochrome C domain-containing protein [Planctomycetaceae bacterium]
MLLSRHPIALLSAVIVTSLGAIRSSGCSAEEPDFRRDIRPILSNHCFPCHGADDDSRAADLRLDVRDEALRLKAIVPGKADESLLFHRITTTVPEEQMPPAEANKPLTQEQIQLLKRWLESGAEYQDHWAFGRVDRPTVPGARADAWCRNDVDAFILQTLHDRGMTHSPEASRPALIRRLYQDLLGLLPSPEETAQFVSDSSPDAYEKLVDRLLASPHYGERWGRHWLDQARYADSNGYTIDGPRVMWPYRDWVIQSLNIDMPFDQFTVEQLAGDLLPDATLSQKVASAFHRNTMINEEGGVKPDQFRHEALLDRVNTTGAVWLGLTVGCAQCHSHKYDPITQEDYYRLYAFFNWASDANSTGETVTVREQELFGWTEEQMKLAEELQSLRKERAEQEKNEANLPALKSLAWDWSQPDVAAVGASGSSILKITPEGSLLAKTHPAANDTLTVKLSVPPVDGKQQTVTAIRLRALTDASLPANGPGTAGNGNFVLSDIALRSGPVEHRFARAWADHSQEKFPVADAIDASNSTGWAINVTGAQVAQGVRMNAPHEAIFAFDQPVTATDGFVTVVLRHDINQNYLVGHFAVDVSNATVLKDLPESDSGQTKAQRDARIAELEKQLPGKGATVRQMVMKDADKPQETFLLTRGEFLSPDKNRGPLSPGIPKAFEGSAPQQTFKTRLDLAQWLVSRENPLTARVIVNRIWGRYFGKGLVETDNDFGYQGSLPTHLDLLNWLAADFMETGWSMKRLHRTIVCSATYRQCSEVTDPAQFEKDPGNLLLGRQSRFRVEAEIVRDMALVASGRLNEKVGGPGVHLPQPDGIYDFTQNKKDWPTATGEERYRRTMYVMFYRSAPYPLMSTFDAPDFSTVCTRRVRSNTPLQSLTVANDVVFTELAEGLGQRILSDATLKSDEERCRRMFELCLCRTPNDQEVELLTNFFSRELSRCLSSKDDAAKLVTQPLKDFTIELQAAWTSTARVLLNTDEFLTRG